MTKTSDSIIIIMTSDLTSVCRVVKPRDLKLDLMRHTF
jgi:hypothetical protein